MVQKELQKAEVRRCQLATQEEVVAQSRVEIFDERAGARKVFHRIDDSIDDAMEFVGERLVQLTPSLPVGRGQERLSLQQASGFYQRQMSDGLARIVGQRGRDRRGDIHGDARSEKQGRTSIADQFSS